VRVIPCSLPSTNEHGAVMSSAVLTEERVSAAAAASVSSQLTSFAEPAPNFVPTFVPRRSFSCDALRAGSHDGYAFWH